MWPLHVRTKEEYIRLIQDALERQESEEVAEHAGQGFEDYRDDEAFAAWCAAVAADMELPDAPAMMARFMERFPLSVHPIQVDWAESMIWQGKIDDASNEARAYLNRMHQAGLKSYLEQSEAVRDGVCRAFLLLTAVYTEAGARSYSRRVIEYAMVLELDQWWQQRFSTEHHRLDEELLDPNLRSLDAVWEDFFQRGASRDRVLDLCARCRLPVLSQRVRLLAQAFDDVEGFSLGDDEIFQMVYRIDSGKFVLA